MNCYRTAAEIITAVFFLQKKRSKQLCSADGLLLFLTPFCGASDFAAVFTLKVGKFIVARLLKL